MMSEPLMVGLDLGTTLCKAGAFELDGALKCQAQREVHTYRPQSAWAEQDPWDWVEAVRQVLAELSERLGADRQRIAAIGLSTHGPNLICTDQNFRPLARTPIWQDQRAAYLCPELIEKAGTGWAGLGMPESSFAVKLYWALLHQADLVREADYLFDAKGFLLAVLTGRAVDEPSSSPGGRYWNRRLFDVLGIEEDKLPDTVPSLSIVGELDPDIRQAANFPAGVQVVAGLNDGAAATLGAGLIELGQGVASLSTNGVMRTTIAERIPGDTLVEKSLFCYSYVDDLFVTGGTTKCGGDSVRWFIDNFLSGVSADEGAVYEMIALDANQSPPGASGVLFMPYLMGMGTPASKKDSQGAFLNLGRHHTRADLTRALLEGIAFSLRDIGETFTALNLGWENLRFTGGGSKNPAWRQIVADVFGKPLTGVRSDSVLGVAITAAVGSGAYPSVRAAVGQMVHETFRVDPAPGRVEIYENLYRQFAKVKPLLDGFLPSHA